MTRAQHFVSISGGKDSTAVACLMVERMQRRDFGNRPPRFIFADTGNEHELTLQHVDYLTQQLGITIETVRADFTGLFEARREAIRRDWPNELRRKKHSKECNGRRAAIPKSAPGCRHSPERAAGLRAWVAACDCPVTVSPPVPQQLIDRVCDLLQPSGNPFLDAAMLHGRFPSKAQRWCTDELKLQPMQQVQDQVRRDGVPAIVWIGERADESKDRAEKPVLEVQRCSVRAPEALYRPIHSWSALDAFAIAKRHGLKPNPLYLMGMGRVGCMPCVLCGRDELREIARRFPEHVARIREWELIVGGVGRYSVTRGIARQTFFHQRTHRGEGEASIDTTIDWARTQRGGRQHDLLVAIEDLAALDAPGSCSSHYRLCE